MRPTSEKLSARKNGYQSDEDNVRYKLNEGYFNKTQKLSPSNKVLKKPTITESDDDVRYMFPTVLTRAKPIDKKHKPRPKIKVNFWSSKQSLSKTHGKESHKDKSSRRHTIAVAENTDIIKQKNPTVRLTKRVSFLPAPLFSDNHIPMVTVPDDLTIHLNEEEANDLGEDLNNAFVNSGSSTNYDKVDAPKRKPKSLVTQTSPKGDKRKRSLDDQAPQIHGNEHELEFFTKYVVQKLRRMETNQRIYSENLINTVLMLGQLGKLNGKSKIYEG